MDGLGLAVFGLPVAAALGIRVVSDYLDEANKDTDARLTVGPSASGTGVDTLTTSVCRAHDVTNRSGTAVDMPTVSGMTTVANVHISTTDSSAAIDVSNSLADNIQASTGTDMINIESISANSALDTFTISETVDDIHVLNSGHPPNRGTTKYLESNNVITDDFYSCGTADEVLTVSTVDDIYASNGTAVDVVKSNSGTPVDDILPSCSAINLLSSKTNIVVLEGNQLSARTKEIETPELLIKSTKLPVTKVDSNFSFVNNEHDIDYESDSESGNNVSSEDSTSSDIFFSLINCKVTDVRLIPPSNQRLEIDCTLEPTLIRSEKKVECRGNVGLPDLIDRTPTVITNSSERCTVNTLKNYCYSCLNNTNDRPRNKFVFHDSLKTISQSQREELPGQDRPLTLDSANNFIHSQTREFSEELKQRSQVIGNPILFASDNNKLTNTEKQSDNNLLPAKNKTNLACTPIESNTTRSEALVGSTRTEYYSGSNQGPNTGDEPSVASTNAEVSEIVTDILLDQQDNTDQHTSEFSDESSDMKIITDSSTHIDIPETPKSPTRQYTVECPVIEPTSPTGKRCMRKMSLEISFVDSPVTQTSPDGKNCMDSRRWSSSTVYNEQESLKRIGRVDTNNTVVDGRIATADRQQQNIRAAVPSHPRGRFMYQFAVPRAYVRTVIGEQARVIRRLRQRTGATISVNYPRGFDGCTCTIEGTYSKVLGAVLILRQNFPLLDWSQDEPSQQTT